MSNAKFISITFVPSLNIEVLHFECRAFSQNETNTFVACNETDYTDLMKSNHVSEAAKEYLKSVTTIRRTASQWKHNVFILKFPTNHIQNTAVGISDGWALKATKNLKNGS